MVYEPAKAAYLSKTLWTNLVMGFVAIVIAFVPAAETYVNSEVVMMIFALVNMVMRMVTKDRVVLW